MARATTYYCDISVGSSGDGSEGSPWKTLADVATGIDALGDDGAGDTVIFSAGTYTTQVAGSPWNVARSDTLTLQAATGETVIFMADTMPTISLVGSSLTDIKLTITGIEIIGASPSPLPEDDGSYHHEESRIIRITDVQNVTISDCDIHAETYRWLCCYGALVTDSSNITFQGNRFHHLAHSGITYFANTGNVSIIGNQFYDIGLGIGPRCYIGNAGTQIIRRNHIFDMQHNHDDAYPDCADEPFMPWNETGVNWHPGTGLSVRPAAAEESGPLWDHMYIQMNVQHHNTAASQALYLYDNWSGYDDITIENNMWIEGTVEFHDLRPSDGHPVLIRNNLKLSTTDASQGIYFSQIVNRYGGSYSITLYSGTDYSYIYHYNNLMIAEPANYFPGASDETFTSNGNLMWAPATAASVPAWKGAKDLFCVWATGAIGPSTAHGNWNAMTIIGGNLLDWFGDTVEYNYNNNPEAEIFTDYARRNFTFSGETFWMSGAIDPAADIADSGNIASESLGEFDADGFILDNGSGHTAEVGPYADGDSFGYPVRPSLPSPFNQRRNVSVDEDLSWSMGLNATTYNVYLGTNKAMVDARDASTLQDTGVSDLTYALSTLSGETTYYWAVDSVDGSSQVGNGVTWEFTTDESPTPPGSPTDPSPADEATGQATSLTLEWTDGGGASTYDVYLSATESQVTGKDSGARIGDDLETETCSSGTLVSGVTYYWRVVATNAQGDTDGDVWQFTTSGSPTGTKVFLVTQ